MTVESLEHFLVASPDVLPLRHDFDLRHAMLPFSLFLSSFSGVQRIMGYVRPRRIVASSKNGEKKEHLEEPSHGVVT